MVAPRWESWSSQKATTFAWRSSACCTMPRWTPRPRPCTRRTTSKPAAEAASMYSSTTDGMSRGANACRSISRPMGIFVDIRARPKTPLVFGLLSLVFTLLIFRRHHRLDSPSHGEVAEHGHPARVNRSHQVVEDLVGHRLVEDALVPEFNEVVLQRLQLDARGVGNVGDSDLPEIGQAGLGADRRELRT